MAESNIGKDQDEIDPIKTEEYLNTKWVQQNCTILKTQRLSLDTPIRADKVETKN